MISELFCFLPVRSHLYETYIRSPAWERKKARYYELYPKACYLCAADKTIDLHHRSYVNLGHEPLYDLLPLCRLCHKTIHRILKDKWPVTKGRQSIWNVARKIKYRLPGGHGELRSSVGKWADFRKRYALYRDSVAVELAKARRTAARPKDHSDRINV